VLGSTNQLNLKSLKENQIPFLINHGSLGETGTEYLWGMDEEIQFIGMHAHHVPCSLHDNEETKIYIAKI